MDSENHNKRDLPEVVADILITLDKVVGRLDQMDNRFEQIHQTQQVQHEQVIGAFNNMTTAVLGYHEPADGPLRPGADHADHAGFRRAGVAAAAGEPGKSGV